MAEVHQSVCGAVSSDVFLPLPPSSHTPVLHIELGAQAISPESYSARSTGPLRFELRLPAQATCEFDLAAGRAIVRPVAATDRTTLSHLIVDHVLPRIAGERMYCLHAAAVTAYGRAYVLAGPSGAGKSTLGVRLARSGAELLGDDCAAIDAGLVHPTFCAGRVRAKSLSALSLSDHLVPDRESKTHLDARHGVKIATAPAPLTAIVLVGERTRHLGVDEALEVLLGQRFHLGGRSQRVLLDEAVALLDRWGPIEEVDRREWSPTGR